MRADAADAVPRGAMVAFVSVTLIGRTDTNAKSAVLAVGIFQGPASPQRLVADRASPEVRELGRRQPRQ
jgi:hypothetical protein